MINRERDAERLKTLKEIRTEFEQLLETVDPKDCLSRIHIKNALFMINKLIAVDGTVHSVMTKLTNRNKSR